MVDDLSIKLLAMVVLVYELFGLLGVDVFELIGHAGLRVLRWVRVANHNSFINWTVYNFHYFT